jgi:multidrug efflux pump subunit AcrA (membrane-fusion protein)
MQTAHAEGARRHACRRAPFRCRISEQLFLDLLHHITRRRRWLLRPRSVQVGETQDGRVEIRAGLAEGETLVVPPR